MKTVAVLSVGRSDYGIYRPVLKELSARTSLRPVVIASGTHLVPEFGSTVHEIENDGFEIAARVDILEQSDLPDAISRSMGRGLIGFSEVYSTLKPDMLMVLGDRFEMMAGTLAALPFRIPVAHLHGGELSQGAIDDSLRHAMTKLSHIHFTSTEPYAERVRQLGEEPWRVHVSGAPGLDPFVGFEPLTRAEFSNHFGRDLPDRFLLVTYHPVTLAHENPGDAFDRLYECLSAAELPVVFTMPNADSGGRVIRQRISDSLVRHRDWLCFESLGTKGYFTAMAYALAMVGNSSSGIIEAASLELPVVNVGARQEGRVRGSNVIDALDNLESMKSALSRALAPEFRASLKGMRNPYGDGHASHRIASVLEETCLDERLLVKKFVDFEVGSET